MSTQPGPDKQGNVPYGALTALSESPLKQGLIYAGTDDGNAWVSENDGKEWTLIREGLLSKWVSRIVASQHELGGVYVTLTGYRDDDFTTYVFASSDRGRNWRSIAANLPGEPVNVILEDPNNRGVLYLGTDLGAYASLDRGRSWLALMSRLPTTPVHDLRVHPRDDELVAGTHGRSVFLLDVAPIQQLTADVLTKDLHLFDVAPTRIARHRPGRPVWEQEPSDDAEIYFYTREETSVELSIRDASGMEVEKISWGSNVGLNLHVWRLSADTAPGEYQIELSTENSRLESTVVIDPPAQPR